MTKSPILYSTLHFIGNKSVELVVATFNRDISWLGQINPVVIKTIYNKNNLIENGIIMPNIGRDVHTFFSHLYNRYDSLSDITFFVQDYPFDHFGSLIETVNENKWEENAKTKFDGYYGFHDNTLGTSWDMPQGKQFDGKNLTCFSNGLPQHENSGFDVNVYWNELFDQTCPVEYEFMPGGHFAITKDCIRKRPREFYKKITDLLERDNISPWCIERLEFYIFSIKYKIK